MLTKSEAEVMHLLWQVKEPLTSTEIVNQSVGASWKKTYVNLLLNSLLDKGMVEIAGVKQTGRNYSRTFTPAVSKEQHFIDCITSNKDFTEENIPTLFSALVQSTKDKNILNQLQEILDKEKKEVDK